MNFLSDFLIKAMTLIIAIQNFISIILNKNINTGDRMIDTAIMGFITLFITFIFSNISIIKKRIFDFIDINFIHSTFDPKNVDPEEYTDTKIQKFAYKYMLSTDDDYDNDIQCGIVIDYFSVEKVIITLYGNVITKECVKTYFNSECNMRIHNENDTKLHMPCERYVKNGIYEYIIISGSTLYCNDIKELSKFLKDFIPEDQCIKVDNKRIVYRINNQGKIVFDSYLNTNKTFDKLHFEKKNHILSILKKFKNGKLYHNGYSLENKLGILTYGPQRTGKTGLASATANYLDRDILLIDCLVKTDRQKILDIVRKNPKKYVIVLDEFDYILCDDKDEESKILSSEDIQKQKEIAEKNKKKEMSDDVFICKLLDSFGNDDGRCIIATTNNPDKINKRYLGTGRFDVVMYMGYCTINMFIDISKPKYSNIELLVEEHKDKIQDILNRNVSPLSLIDILNKTKDFEQCLYMLENKTKEADYPIFELDNTKYYI